MDLASLVLSVPEDCSISNPACFGPAVLWYFKYFKYYTYFNSSLPWPAVLWYCSIAEEFQLGCPTTVAWALPSLPTAALQWPPLDIREGQPTKSWPFGRNNWLAVRQLTNHLTTKKARVNYKMQMTFVFWGLDNVELTSKLLLQWRPIQRSNWSSH